MQQLVAKELSISKDYFVVIMSEYIFIPWKHAQERAARLAADDGGHISNTPSITLAGAATIEAEDVVYLREGHILLHRQAATNYSRHSKAHDCKEARF
ncbi:unnamed protein product [Calypogeia fissa]